MEVANGSTPDTLFLAGYGDKDKSGEDYNHVTLETSENRDVISLFIRGRDEFGYEEAMSYLTPDEALMMADALTGWAHERIEEGFNCVDCSVNTGAIDEYYMVKDEVWAEAQMNAYDGMLCIGCLETRLGYQLNRSHFTDCPLNVKDFTPKSDRLKSRFAAQEIAA